MVGSKIKIAKSIVVYITCSYTRAIIIVQVIEDIKKWSFIKCIGKPNMG